MSFLQYKKLIAEGDTVIVCRGHDKMWPVQVERGKLVQVRGGAVHHEALIGVEYGSKVPTSNGKSWVTVLHPTPELWTMVLPHRTQILYSTNISLITLQLGLRPGSKVVECGTGSGSLSHALVRTIAPDGHLYTFEFHEQRAKIASEEFVSHGLSDVVTLTCRDVCTNGFGLEGVADAVFLDVPKPWEAVESAKVALKVCYSLLQIVSPSPSHSMSPAFYLLLSPSPFCPMSPSPSPSLPQGPGCRICSFSPCLEQVQRTCEALQRCGFVDIDIIECLQRPFEVRQCALAIPNMGLSQTDTGCSHTNVDISLTEADCYSRKRPRDTSGVCQISGDSHVTKDGNSVEAVEHRTAGESHMTGLTSGTHLPTKVGSAYKDHKLVQPIQSSVTVHTAQPCKAIPGHTGFLTFATLSAMPAESV